MSVFYQYKNELGSIDVGQQRTIEYVKKIFLGPRASMLDFPKVHVSYRGVEFFYTNSIIPETTESDPLEITVDRDIRLRKTYLLDIDGTILIRGPAVVYPTSELLPNSQFESDQLPYGSFFEARPIYFLMKRKKYPVFFRRGLYDLLTMLSSDEDSKIVLATHACPIYANRICEYIQRHVKNLNITVETTKRDTCKVPPIHYEFILEDKPHRWKKETARITRIPELTISNVQSDNWLLAFAISCQVNNPLPLEIIHHILGFAGSNEFIPLTLCPHCQFYIASINCIKCKVNRNSDTSHSDFFESEGEHND